MSWDWCTAESLKMSKIALFALIHLPEANDKQTGFGQLQVKIVKEFVWINIIFFCKIWLSGKYKCRWNKLRHCYKYPWRLDKRSDYKRLYIYVASIRTILIDPATTYKL